MIFRRIIKLPCVRVSYILIFAGSVKWTIIFAGINFSDFKNDKRYMVFKSQFRCYYFCAFPSVARMAKVSTTRKDTFTVSFLFSCDLYLLLDVCYFIKYQKMYVCQHEHCDELDYLPLPTFSSIALKWIQVYV